MLEFKKISREDIKKLNEIRNLCVDYLHNSTKFSLEESYKWFDKETPNYYSIFLNNETI